MTYTNFGTFLDLRKNSFGFLRFFFAIAVLYHHSFPLGGFSNEPFAHLLDYQENAGSIAVLSFFIISGFLIVHSSLFTKTTLSYSWKRFLRIIPAFWVCLIVTAFLFAPIAYWVEHHTLQGFLSMKQGPFDYIKSNFLLFMHQFNIGNLLDKSPTPHIFDGSLWTLILETKGYIALGILGIFPFIKKRREIYLALFIVLAGIFITHLQIPKSGNILLHFFIDPTVFTYTTYFFAGVIFYLYRKEIPANVWLAVLALVISIVATYFHFLHIALLFTAPYIIFWLAGAIPFYNFTEFGDFSYGIYIYAFPIQQLLYIFKLNGNFFVYILLSFLITMVFAVASWYLIEKPALGFKKVLK